MAGDARQLPPGLAAGMPIGVDGAMPEPAERGALLIRTELLLRIARTVSSPGEDQPRRWRAGRLWVGIEALLTRVAPWFVDESSEGLRLFGALPSGTVRLERRLGCGAGIVGLPDMEHEADEYESDQ
jgi:hypothetical protein